MNLIYKKVQSMAQAQEQLWWQMPCTMPELPKISHDDKLIQQQSISSILGSFDYYLKNLPKDQSQFIKWQTELSSSILKNAKGCLGISNKNFENKILQGCISSAQDFVDKSREFDKSITSSDIYQALRNIWIINIIQAAANVDIKCTKSALGYSLLYPYTDNYLDDCKVSTDCKNKLNKQIKNRLKGKKISPSNNHESKIFSLIAMIESQYSHKKHPQVFESILSIHKAQCKSLNAQNAISSPYQNNILYTSFEKGGSSVLADAYVSCGEINKKLSEFSFGFGTILQLLDDLQDVKKDKKSNSMTIFTQTIPFCNLDAITNKLMHFVISGINYDCLKESKKDIKSLIISNIMTLIIISVYNNKDLYSKNYLKELEKYSPISFDYLKRNDRVIKKLKSKLINLRA